MSVPQVPSSDVPPYVPQEYLGISEGPGLSLESHAEVIDEPLLARFGAVPPGLRGTLYRNGPALYIRGGIKGAHPLDGDGCVHRYAFSDAGVSLTSRFVRTAEFRREMATQTRVKRAFGTRATHFIDDCGRRAKNCANTAVVFHGERLYTCWEGGLPYVLDGDTLLPRHEAEYDFDGELREYLFSAHPVLDPRNGEMFNFSSTFNPSMFATFGLFGVDSVGKVLRKRYYDLKHKYYIHDIAMTQQYVIAYFNSQWMDTKLILFGLKVPAQLVTVDRPAKILIFDRATLDLVCEIEGPRQFSFHDINAFDEGADIVVDYCMYDEPPRWWRHVGADWLYRNTGFGVRPYPYRMRLSLTTKRYTMEPLADVPMEMATLHPNRATLPYRYAYGIPSLLPRTNSIVKLDVHAKAATVRNLGPTFFTEEPIFVPREHGVAEDDGYLVFPALDAAKKVATLWILDARDILAEPVAVLEAKAPLSLSFHGQFVPR